jgi:hypothetical protein
MSPYLRMATTVATTLFVTGLVARSSRARVKEPPYVPMLRSGPLEIRRYDSYVLAETVVEGGLDDASNEGFRRLFRYISGQNRRAAKIEMTAPVTVEARGRKIPMTAPVGAEKQGGGWVVSFVLPAGMTLDDAPVPLDSRISLRSVPARKMAVLRFSGYAPEKKVEKETWRLQELATKEGLTLSGEPILARYDPPWTLPFLRRNEIAQEIAGTESRD